MSTSFPRSKRTIGLAAIAALGCGGILLIGLCIVLAVILPNRPTTPGSSSGKSIGTLKIDSSGGSFQNEEIRLRVSPGPALEPMTLTVYKDSSPGQSFDGFTSIHPQYRLSGPLTHLKGEIQITLTLEANDLAGKQPGVLALEEAVLVPGTGMVMHLVPLESKIDAKSHTITARLRLDNAAASGALPRPFVAGLLAAPLAYQQDSPEEVGIRLIPGLMYDAYQSEHFTLSYLSKLHKADLAKQTVLLLEKQYSKLTDLGFEFRGVKRIHVTVKALDGRTGQFVSSMLGPGYCSLELSSEYFKKPELFKSSRDELVVTIGHELLHFAQFSMNPSYALTKAKLPLATLWMDEAVATWYEALALENSEYIPSNADRNKRFVATSLMFPPEPSLYPVVGDLTPIQDHGYGASLFIRYLSAPEHYGPHFPAEIFTEIADGATANQALDLALQRHMTDFATEWPSFLQSYYGDPSEVAPGLNNPPSRILGLSASLKADKKDYTVRFAPKANLKENVKSSKEGSIKSGEPANIQLKFSQPAQTADAVVLALDGTDDSKKAFKTPGTLLIVVDSPKDSGVLVLAQKNGASSYTPLAPAPFGYLSSGDPMSESGPKLMVSKFGYPKNEFSRLLLIPFEHSDITSGPGEPASITVQLTYWTEEVPAEPPAEQPPAEPPPTMEEPPPASTSNHACQGVSLADMQKKNIKSKKCWITCFGIGSTPSDGEMQTCIELNR